MRSSATLRALGTALLLCSAVLSVRAQAFIPDTLMRGWLNQAIPGIVDANGIMDTLHPGIAALDTFDIQSSSMDPVGIDLTGLEYLDSTVFFNFHDNTVGLSSLHIPPFPASLETCAMLLWFVPPDSLRLPVLRHPLKNLTIAAPGNEINLVIPNILDTLDLLQVGSVRSFTMNGAQGYIREMNVTLSHFPEFIIPPMQIGALTVDFEFFAEVDLSNCTVRDLVIYHTVGSWVGDISFPVSCDSLFLLFVLNSTETFSDLPADLRSLTIHIQSLDCVPHLPNGLRSFWINGGAVDCIPNWPDSMQTYFGPMDAYQHPIVCSILNSSCPGNGAGFGGTCFVDTDQDGLFDSGEPPMPHAVISIQNNMYLAPAGPDGRWQQSVPPGTYTLEPVLTYPYTSSVSPQQYTDTLAAYGEVDSLRNFGYTLIPNMQDLVVNFSTWVARPGFDNTLWLNYQNYGTTVVNGELSFTFDSDQTWVSSSVPPTTLVGNTATWSFPNMPINMQGSLTVTLHTATTVPLGTPIIHTLSFDPVATDQTPLNNVQLWTDSVVGSYDPNDKLLSPGVMSPADVLAGDMPITYTIRFQNTGTFPAERVVILDTLSADLKWESMRFLGSSHPCQWYIDEGVLHVVFDPIQLPDSTSDEAGSHGMVMFSMLPSDQLQNGSTVTNIAHIVFDYNEPIITPPAIFTVDIAASVRNVRPPMVQVYPNPTNDHLFVTGLRHGRSKYRVLDQVGRSVLSGTLDTAGKVDVSFLSIGTYMLLIQDGEVQHRLSFQKQ